MTGVGMFAANPHVDLAHAVTLALFDIVDEIKLARLLKETRIGPDVGEDKAASTVDIPNQSKIHVHF